MSERHANPDGVNFIWDEALQRYQSVAEHYLPEVFILHWDGGDALPPELALPGEATFGARLIPVDLTASSPLPDLTAPHVASCVLLLSPAAMRHATFPAAVNACTHAIATRREFRLFVRLGGMSLDALREGAKHPDENGRAAADLLDSVQLSDNPAAVTSLLESLRPHLRALPDLRDDLQRQAWQTRIHALIRFAHRGFVLLAIGALLALAFLGESAPEHRWFPWLLMGLGAFWYFSTLTGLSLLSPSGSSAMFHFKVMTTAAPILLLWTWPPAVLAPYGAFLLAGYAASALLDAAQRRAAQARRVHMSVDPAAWSAWQDRLPTPGAPSFQHFNHGPLFPPKARVFISYARSSEWGRRTAQRLHAALQQAGASSFFDVENIPAGCSWRHRLQESLGSATVFIQVQDHATTTRPWVATELAVAASSQASCGLPKILILRHPALSDPTDLPPEAPQLVRETLFPPADRPRPLLQVIAYSDDVPQALAHKLARYPGSGVAVIALVIAAVLELAMAPLRVLLGVLAVLGTFGAWAILGLFVILWLRDESPLAWITAREWNFWLLPLAAFWLGCVVRLSWASRFELRHHQAGANARWQDLSAGALLGVLSWLLTAATPLEGVYAALACGLGMIVTGDYIAVTLPLARRLREQPNV